MILVNYIAIQASGGIFAVRNSVRGVAHFLFCAGKNFKEA